MCEGPIRFKLLRNSRNVQDMNGFFGLLRTKKGIGNVYSIDTVSLY